METTGVLALFGVFGVVCGLYVSIVGFAVTALVFALLLTLVAYVVGGLLGGWMPALAFLAMQVGYVLCLVGTALAIHVRGLPKDDARRTTRRLHINHE